MTTPKEKIQSMIATAKKAGEGDFREKAINSQTFYVMANPTAFITLAESLLACLEALEQANLRFMAMGNSTMENGAPGKTELISMCENSAIRMQQAIAQVEKKIGAL